MRILTEPEQMRFAFGLSELARANGWAGIIQLPTQLCICYSKMLESKKRKVSGNITSAQTYIMLWPLLG